jgi:hypothetical protein
VISGLAYATIAVALFVAAWALLATARDRAPGRALFVGVYVVFGLVVVVSLIGLVRLPGSGVDAGLFIGYVLTAVLLPPAAVILARMEPTRWGSAILAGGTVVIAPLMVRLLQIWAGA